MLTHKELIIHYDRVSALYQTKLSVSGLQTYREELKQNQNMLPDPELLEALEADIAELENAIQRDAEDIEARTAEVEITLKQLPGHLDQAMARLHFIRGLTWKEVGAVLGCTEAAAKTRVYRALKAAGIS